jgi:putative membrane protein
MLNDTPISGPTSTEKNPRRIETDDRVADSRASLLANVLSVIVPVVVALLLAIPTKIDLGAWTKWLPHAIGGINALTSLLLVAGWIAIRGKKIAWHRAAMTSAFALGAMFLVCYVTYHLSNPSTKFGGEGWIRTVYYFILLSHIGLSLLVLPLVLRAFLFAWMGRFEAHRRIARYAYPVWLYVSVTGVIAYWMISPYYQHG